MFLMFSSHSAEMVELSIRKDSDMEVVVVELEYCRRALVDS